MEYAFLAGFGFVLLIFFLICGVFVELVAKSISEEKETK